MQKNSKTEKQLEFPQPMSHPVPPTHLSMDEYLQFVLETLESLTPEQIERQRKYFKKNITRFRLP